MARVLLNRLSRLIFVVLTAVLVFCGNVGAAGATGDVLAQAQSESCVYVSDIPMTSWIMYEATSEDENPRYRPNIDQNEAGGPLTIAGVVFDKGLRSHPCADESPAEMKFDISEYQYDYFVATVGRDSGSVGAGYVSFEVLVDGNSAGVSPELTLGESAVLIAYVRGGQELTLLIHPVDTHHHDSAAFGDARLCNLEVESMVMAELPFKVTYKQGELLSVAGGVVTTNFSGGGQMILDLTKDMVSGFDSSIIGEQTLTVTFGGKTTEFNINVEGQAATPSPTKNAAGNTPTHDAQSTQPQDASPEPTDDSADDGILSPAVMIVVCILTAAIVVVVVVVLIARARGKRKS